VKSEGAEGLGGAKDRQAEGGFCGTKPIFAQVPVQQAVICARAGGEFGSARAALGRRGAARPVNTLARNKANLAAERGQRDRATQAQSGGPDRVAMCAEQSQFRENRQQGAGRRHQGPIQPAARNKANSRADRLALPLGRLGPTMVPRVRRRSCSGTGRMNRDQVHGAALAGQVQIGR
jgi:hypothetical protein